MKKSESIRSISRPTLKRQINVGFTSKIQSKLQSLWQSPTALTSSASKTWRMPSKGVKTSRSLLPFPRRLILMSSMSNHTIITLLFEWLSLTIRIWRLTALGLMRIIACILNLVRTFYRRMRSWNLVRSRVEQDRLIVSFCCWKQNGNLNVIDMIVPAGDYYFMLKVHMYSQPIVFSKPHDHLPIMHFRWLSVDCKELQLWYVLLWWVQHERLP